MATVRTVGSRWIVVGLGLAACGSGDGAPWQPPEPEGTGGGVDEPCDPGAWLVDGEGCRAAGLPADFVEPGPSGTVDAGVPEGACGQGFTSDGLGGCSAVLPSAACGAGLMAVPGDVACREVASCGDA